MKMAIEIGTSVYGSEQHPFI